MLNLNVSLSGEIMPSALDCSHLVVKEDAGVAGL